MSSGAIRKGANPIGVVSAAAKVSITRKKPLQSRVKNILTNSRFRKTRVLITALALVAIIRPSEREAAVGIRVKAKNRRLGIQKNLTKADPAKIAEIARLLKKEKPAVPRSVFGSAASGGRRL